MDQTTPHVPDEQEMLLSFVYMCPVGILQISNDGAVQMLNPMVSQLLMPVAPGGVFTNLFDVLERCAPELCELVSSYAAPRGKICDDHRLRVGDSGGHPKVLACTMLRMDPHCIMVMLNDISDQVAQERRLKQADAWLAAIFSNVQDFAYFSLDERGLINSWSPSGLTQTGYTDVDVLGRSLEIFLPADERPQGHSLDQIACARREGFHLHEGRCVTRDGRTAWWQILVTAVKEDDGAISGFNVVLRDVTERKITLDELRRLLTTDHLTGAANRAHFSEVLASEAARRARYGRDLSVIMLDADHFKLVNDRHGHDAGDHVLRTLVDCCKGLLRDNDVLARYGGEEFVIMLPATDSAGAFGLAERLRLAVAEAAMLFNGARIEVTISLGCASMGGGLETPEALLKAADMALYEAKRLGRNRSCVHPAGTASVVAVAPVTDPAASREHFLAGAVSNGAGSS